MIAERLIWGPRSVELAEQRMIDALASFDAAFEATGLDESAHAFILYETERMVADVQRYLDRALERMDFNESN